MKGQTVPYLIFAAFFSWAPWACRAQTNTLIVPKEAATTFGDAAFDPFGSAPRVEQIYGATEFKTLSSDIILITGISWRVDEHETHAMDFALGESNIRMNTFTGSVQQAVSQRTGIQPPVTTVVNGANRPVTGEIGTVDTFDVRIPFDAPFLYDRRLGQLVLSITFNGASGVAVKIDAQGIYDVPGDPNSGIEWPYRRGAYLEHMPGAVNVSDGFLVTEFTFIEIRAVIDAIRDEGSTVSIDYTVSVDGTALVPYLESATSVDGSYSVVKNADFSPIGPGKTRATVPAEGYAQFFRIRLE